MTPLVPGQLDHAPLGRERSLQDGQPARRAEGLVDGAHHLLPGCLARQGAFLFQRPPADGRAVLQQAEIEEALHDQPLAARPLQVGRDEAPARLHVDDDGRLGGDGAELVDRQRDARLVRDGEQMQDGVGRAGAGRHADDGVVEGRARGGSGSGADLRPEGA